MKKIIMAGLLITSAIGANAQTKIYAVTKTDAEWHKLLTEEQFFHKKQVVKND